MNILKLPKWISDEECQRLLKWIDSLEIQEVQELEQIYKERNKMTKEMITMREFWIEFGGDPSDDKEIYKRYCSAAPFDPNGLGEEVIRVREVSPALDAAYAEFIDKMKSIVRGHDDRCSNIEFCVLHEIMEALAALRKARK